MIDEKPLLQLENYSATIPVQTEYVVVKRSDLLQEHQALLARVQKIRHILGLAPLPTGKQRRLTQHK